MKLSEYDLKLIRALVKRYIGESEQSEPHSGVDQLLMGGIVIECRRLVAEIDKALGDNSEPQKGEAYAN